MMRKLAVTAVTALFVLVTSSLALCADIVGTVSDTQGNPVPGVQIAAQTVAGKVVAQVLTKADGKYKIPGLDTGTYECTLNPLHTDFKGGNASAQLGSKGLTINWKLSATAPAIALASEGTEVALAGDPFGFSPLAFTALVGLSVADIAAGVVGGYGAAGGFSGPAASPSL